MPDPTKTEPRNASAGGETPQESVDRMAGDGMGGVSTPLASRGSSHPATYPVMARGPDTHPSATHTYGAPVGMPILKARDGT